MLDADDRLEGAADLRAFLESAPPEDAFLLLIRSPLEVADDQGPRWEALWQPRVFRTGAGVRYRYPVHNIPILEGLATAAAPGRIHHVGYLTEEIRCRKAERTLRLLERLPEGDPHRLYHHARALGGLLRFAVVPPIAEQLAGVVKAVPPDVRVMWSHALVEQGRPHDAVRVLCDGLADHPKHPDLYYALLMAAGVGYAGASLDIHRAHDLFGGVAVTLGRAPRVVEGLVHMGVLAPAILDSPVMQTGEPTTTTGAPGAAGAEHEHP